MYDGFERDLAEALDRGEGEVGTFIRDTAAARGLAEWDVFAATARQRLAWERGDHSTLDRRPRHRSGARRGRRRRAVGGAVRQLLSRSGRRTLASRATRYAVAAGWRSATWAATKGRKAAIRAARRAAKRARRLSHQLATRARRLTRGATTQARRAGKWAFPIIYRLWTGKQLPGKPSWPLIYQLWTGKKWKPRPRPKKRPPVPAPSPALASYLAGATEREVTYTVSDPAIRDPKGDWLGALEDFRTINRKYIGTLQQLLAEEPTK